MFTIASSNSDGVPHLGRNTSHGPTAHSAWKGLLPPHLAVRLRAAARIGVLVTGGGRVSPRSALEPRGQPQHGISVLTGFFNFFTRSILVTATLNRPTFPENEEYNQSCAYHGYAPLRRALLEAVCLSSFRFAILLDLNAFTSTSPPQSPM